jgi:hypothetical protein
MTCAFWCEQRIHPCYLNYPLRNHGQVVLFCKQATLFIGFMVEALVHEYTASLVALHKRRELSQPKFGVSITHKNVVSS